MLIRGQFPRFFFKQDDGGTTGGQGAATPAANDKPVETTDDEPFDKARAMNTINTLRKIEKDYEKLKSAEEKRTREQLSETDRIKAEKTDLERKLAEAQGKTKQVQARASVITAAAKAGFNDPDDAWNMLKESLTISDDGEVDGLEKSLNKLAESKPYLVKSAGGETKPPTTPGKQPSPGNPGTKPGLTKDALKNMTQQEIAARWNDPAFQKDIEAAQKGS